MVKRLSVALILACVVVLALATVALSQVWLSTITSSVNIVEGTKSIIVYSDPGLTNPVTSINFGAVGRGSSNTEYFYIKNDGGETLYIVMQTSDISDWGTSTFTPVTPFLLSPGSSASCSIRLDIGPNASMGSKNFDIYIGE